MPHAARRTPHAARRTAGRGGNPAAATPEQIRAARAAAHLTQETLAERVGLDRKTVNRIEQGAYPTNIDRLLLIAAALDRPLADLVR